MFSLHLRLHSILGELTICAVNKFEFQGIFTVLIQWDLAQCTYSSIQCT